MKMRRKKKRVNSTLMTLMKAMKIDESDEGHIIAKATEHCPQTLAYINLRFVRL
jgi:hypothetical protein